MWTRLLQQYGKSHKHECSSRVHNVKLLHYQDTLHEDTRNCYSTVTPENINVEAKCTNLMISMSYVIAVLWRSNLHIAKKKIYICIYIYIYISCLYSGMWLFYNCWIDFYEILCLESLLQDINHLHFWHNSDNNNEHFALRPTCVLASISNLTL
jgi:hypothetical protein